MKINILHIFRECKTVSTDSRNVAQGSIFFSLKGHNYDGNSFALDALTQGAKYAVIDNPKYKIDERFIIVENTLITLQQLAKEYRSTLTRLKLIAIAGSNGKTTTRELIYRVLKTKYRTTTTRGNLNNHIGLPLSILTIEESDEFAVIEMGANHREEHVLLCEIAMPQFGIITNNGKDHLEGYGSFQAVIESNKELYDYLLQQKATAFVNADDPVLLELSEKIPRQLYGRFASGQIPETLVSGNISMKFPFLSVDVKIKTGNHKLVINSNLFGSFQLYNILAAAAVGCFFDIGEQLIKQAIESYIPANNRSQFLKWKGNTVLLDAYNANPTSMEQMINDLNEYQIDNKLLVLGDMMELGLESKYEHRYIVEILKHIKVKEIILIGKEFGRHSKQIKCLHFFKRSRR